MGEAQQPAVKGGGEQARQAKHVMGTRAAASSRAIGKSLSPLAALSNTARLSAPRMTSSNWSQASSAGIVSDSRSNGASGGSGSGVSLRTVSGASARGSVVGKQRGDMAVAAHAQPGQREMGGRSALLQRDDPRAGGFEQFADAADVAGGIVLGDDPVIARARP